MSKENLANILLILLLLGAVMNWYIFVTSSFPEFKIRWNERKKRHAVRYLKYMEQMSIDELTAQVNLRQIPRNKLPGVNRRLRKALKRINRVREKGY